MTDWTPQIGELAKITDERSTAYGEEGVVTAINRWGDCLVSFSADAQDVFAAADLATPETMFAEMDAMGDAITVISYDELRAFRAAEDKRLRDQYGFED